MRDKRFLWAMLVIAGFAAALLWLKPGILAAQTTAATQATSANQAVPRTPWGDPDLQGIWQPELTGTPLQRAIELGTRAFFTEQEMAQRARRGPVEDPAQAEEAAPARATSDARLASRAGRDEAENAKARPHEAALLGNRYNAWWTAGPERKKSPNPPWNRTSLIVDPPDGRMPAYTMEALKRVEARDEARKNRSEADGPEDRNLLERCLLHVMAGSGASGALSSVKQIIQSPGYVTIIYDGFDAARTIPVDGRPAPDDRIRTWLGVPRGRWEGNSLVVEITNINDKQDGGPIAASHNDLLPGIHQHQYMGSGATAKITERYTRVSPTRIEFSQTITDPAVYMRPYMVLVPLELSNDFMMLENACHEGNYGMVELLGGGRKNPQSAQIAADAERATRKQQMEVLKKQTEDALKARPR